MESFAAKRLINKEAKLARSLLLRVLLLLQHPDLDYRNHSILRWSKTCQKLQTSLALHLSLSLSLSSRRPFSRVSRVRLFSRLVVSLERAPPKNTNKAQHKNNKSFVFASFWQMEQTNK